MKELIGSADGKGETNVRRVWFKREMKQAILEGKKTATTRNHPLPLDTVVAVSGSRFKAEPFALLQIMDRLPMKKEVVFRMFYVEEGFKSTEEAVAYAKKEKLLESNNTVFFHRFRVVMKL